MKASSGRSLDPATNVLDAFLDPDGTVKLRVGLADGAVVECVLLKDRGGRKTACLSSQAGCAQGCLFCGTGSLGLSRNLETREILEQYHHLDSAYGPVGNVVFMGMGEPLDNLQGLGESIAALTDPRGVALAPRHITVSTSGIVPAILELAEKGPSVGLAVSLVTADEEERRRLMPGTRRWSLAELKEALKRHQAKTRKRLTVEIVLLKGLNDDLRHAELLEGFLEGLDVVVNLIPWNPVPGLGFSPACEEAVQLYYGALTSAGIPAVRRHPRGASVCGACGQLGLSVPGRP